MEKPFSSTATTAAGVRIEVWDKDAIGSDEFMGYVFLDFAKLKNDVKPQYESVDLKPREGKKDKVSGSLFLNYTFYGSAWHQEYLAAEAKKKAEEEAARQKAAAERQAKIDEITSGDNHGCSFLARKPNSALCPPSCSNEFCFVLQWTPASPRRLLPCSSTSRVPLSSPVLRLPRFSPSLA
jgi:hypothetical protein